jgi:PAS domain S-box-containing protein
VSQTPASNEEIHGRLAAIVASSDDAIISKDLDGIVQSWNAAAERIYGYTAAEMIGQPITLVIPPDRPDEEPQILERLKRGERVDHFETVRVHKDGHLIDVSVTISPIRGANGQIIGASKISRDITHLKRITREREQLYHNEQAARKEAERLNRVKDEFLATLSHELRTPLNAILGWSHILRSSTSPQDLSQGLETIERNARLQTQLIEELLDVSRIISGKLRLDVQRVDLPTVVAESLESVRPAADAKHIRLSKVIDPSAGPVMGDSARLQQVMWNLLTNAVKYTTKAGRIQVLVHRVASQVHIEVSDNGQGIEPDFLPHLFTRFAQADSSTTRRHGGLGLGLAIVRHLVELHGGTVLAASAGAGQGATFTVQLPLAVIHQTPSVEGHTPPGATPGTAVASMDLTGVKALIVDDEPDACALVQRLLEANHAIVVAAQSAAQALELLRKERPDVLLSDIGMPGEDGYQLLKKVRELPASEGGATPAVALTAFARSEDRRRALIAGFQLHVPKPVEPAELLTVVASLTGKGRKNNGGLAHAGTT